jgi:predicted Zn finger-like uncharacterized protein
MEITCKRCQTEYDFDDALVSERGTTVRCTNCGEQFKVFRSSSAPALERWLVQRRDGRELLFTNIGDLQRAITHMQVGRHDVLVRGAEEPRPLGAIPELEPYFLSRLGRSTPPPGGSPGATQPYGPVHSPGGTQRPPTQASPAQAAPVLVNGQTAPAFGALQGNVEAAQRPQLRPPSYGTIPGFAPAPATPEPAAPVARPSDANGETPSPFDVHAQRLLDSASRVEALRASAPGGEAGVFRGPSAFSGMADEASGSLDDPSGDTDDSRRPARAGSRSLDPSYDSRDPARISYGPEQDWFAESTVSTRGRRRGRGLRGLVLLLLLGLLGVAGATVGRKYVAAIVRPPPRVDVASGPRVDALLDEGERAFAEGDLDTAKEAFDKASALAERDPRVALAEARSDAVRADREWLKLRLLRADQTDALTATKQQLKMAAQRASRSATRLSELAPDDPKTARARIDAARLAGDLASARSLAATLAPIASQPETVYVLAALDLAQDTPNWPAVIERLQTAASGEQNLARARIALVYALARSGDARLARAELDKLASSPRPPALLPELKTFVAASDGKDGKRGASGASASAASAGPVPGAAAASAATPAAPVTNSAVGGGARPPVHSEPAPAPATGDFRALLQQAAKAQASRQYDRADQLYRAALAKNPGDNEALGGLGDVARARGNTALARSYYEQVLARNAHYLPALSGLADIQWEAGERTSAAGLYRQLVEASPDSPLAKRARERIAQADGSATPKPQREAPAETAPTPPSDVPSGVDTSDLPELQR